MPVQAEVEAAWAARGAALRASKAASAEAAAAADARLADARARAATQARQRAERDASLKVGSCAALAIFQHAPQRDAYACQDAKYCRLYSVSRFADTIVWSTLSPACPASSMPK